MPVDIYMCICVCVYVSVYMYLCRAGVADSHRQMRIFWGNCESLWPTDSQIAIFLSHCESYLVVCESFFKLIHKKTLFLVLTPFLGKFHA